MTIAIILLSLTFKYTAIAIEKPEHFLFHKKTLRGAGKEFTRNCHLSLETVSFRSQHSFLKQDLKHLQYP